MISKFEFADQRCAAYLYKNEPLWKTKAAIERDMYLMFPMIRTIAKVERRNGWLIVHFASGSDRFTIMHRKTIDPTFH